ncbi:phytoene dehydrogenase-like protein [Halopolyspora algeriensis]|uniref:Phytoene dehydrogenase-like protein n=1 Tax=Halopolyspora algeriensis TaxID=1500506 RepID=A0A368VHZ5_9ACTN|nr:NAD(P)/FAD-dependent oxidoreductase [Halopolyspora algeriensis]RCW41018.1 phytoene dehydrogenase-like protein [Halopolyspora algeriensis]TQM53898.1 phytoene dehydrogenase-like protein [Halopolyspora algeriensis]
MTDAVVVGSGPNGLAAAVVLASEGVRVRVLEAADTIGGGTRSSELTLPGLLHDECSGFHPLAVDTPFSRQYDLQAHGLRWLWPDVQYTHPLDNGRGGAVYRSVEETAAEIGADGAAWRSVFGALTERFGGITEDFLRPMLHVPAHPLLLARFGAYAAMPATLLGRRWSSPEARALFGGVAAHALRPFGSPMSSAIGVALGTAAHACGWPVAQGGSQAIATTMASLIEKSGGSVETGVRVESLAELGAPDLVLLDTSPADAVRITGDRMPRKTARAYRRYRHGPGAFKVDYAVEGGVPWAHEPSRRAGTVHVCGSFAETAAVERQVNQGVMPDRPFVLVGQQSVADPSRSAGNLHPVYTYAHVPSGYTGDATEAITAQIERFAPGFRDTVRATHVRSTTDMSVHNPNYVGGDIVSGANSAWQLVSRPRVALDPYATGIPGVYLCSAATPPGAGAHGMCGFHAARSALEYLKHGTAGSAREARKSAPSD